VSQAIHEEDFFARPATTPRADTARASCGNAVKRKFLCAPSKDGKHAYRPHAPTSREIEEPLNPEGSPPVVTQQVRHHRIPIAVFWLIHHSEFVGEKQHMR